jgi:hypothetical protein
MHGCPPNHTPAGYSTRPGNHPGNRVEQASASWLSAGSAGAAIRGASVLRCSRGRCRRHRACHVSRRSSCAAGPRSERRRVSRSCLRAPLLRSGRPRFKRAAKRLPRRAGTRRVQDAPRRRALSVSSRASSASRWSSCTPHGCARDRSRDPFESAPSDGRSVVLGNNCSSSPSSASSNFSIRAIFSSSPAGSSTWTRKRL